MKGILLQSLDKEDEAEKVYRKIVEIDPKFSPALNNLAWILAEKGEIEEAFILAQKAREQAPHNPFILDTYGWIQFKRGSYDLAISAFQNALDQHPDFLPARYHLALALLKKGRKAEAIEELEKVVKSPLKYPEKQRAKELLESLKKS